MTSQDSDIKPIVILMPCFNDWTSLRQLLRNLDQVLPSESYPVAVVVVDDAPSMDSGGQLSQEDLHRFSRLTIVRLRLNMGNQRAIAIGLSYLSEHHPCRAVIVMDSDGEDTPADVVRLLEQFELTKGTKAVFARRSKRSEPLLFRLGYFAYRFLYYCLSGQRIRIGNFSLLPEAALHRVVAISEIWSVYPVGFMRAKIPYIEIATTRGKRIDGKSKMNVLALIVHGLSAIAVNSETVGIRFLVLSTILSMIVMTGIAIVVGIKFGTTLAIPGWASSVVGLLVVILTQLGLFSLFFIFFILSSRNSYRFLPCRDYKHYMLVAETVGEGQ